MYKKSREFTYHLLLHYEVARDVRVSIFRVFGVEWVMPRRVVELLVSCRGQLENHCRLEARRIAHVCLIRCIWRN